jgi:hypothetical protein
MVLAFYVVYFVGLVCLYVVLSHTYGLIVALVVLGAIPASGLLLLVLYSSPSAREHQQQPGEVGL